MLYVLGLWNVLILILSKVEDSAACDVFMGANNEEPLEVGKRLTLDATFNGNNCFLSRYIDRIVWQKRIGDNWIDMFECTGKNENGTAINRGDYYDIVGRSEGKLRRNEDDAIIGHSLIIPEVKVTDSGSWRVMLSKVTSDETKVDVIANIQPKDVKVNMEQKKDEL